MKEYLNDKVRQEFHGQIEKVVAFSQKAKLNYDCLRAIAFELNLGRRLEDAIEDLNIINMGEKCMKIRVHFKSGNIYAVYNNINIFDGEKVTIYFNNCEEEIDEYDSFYLSFVPTKSILPDGNRFLLKKGTFEVYSVDYDEDKAKRKSLTDKVEKVSLESTGGAKDYGFNFMGF